MLIRYICIFAIACASELLNAQVQDSGLTQELEARYQTMLDSLNKSNDTQAVYRYTSQLRFFRPADTNTPSDSLLGAKTSRMLQAFSELEKRIDPKFDMNDLPRMNLAVPGGKGFAGVAPHSIKDDKVRKEYEVAIAANKVKAEKYLFQYKLRRTKEDLLTTLERFIRTNYPNEPRSIGELTNYFNEFKIETNSQIRILNSLKNPK